MLILNGTDPYLPAYLEIDGAMRASLAQETARRIVFFSEPLDAQRFPVEAVEPELLALARQEVPRASHRRGRGDQPTRAGILQTARRAALAGRATRVLRLAGGGPGSSGASTGRDGRRHASGLRRNHRPRAAPAARCAAHSRRSPARRTWTGETSGWRGSSSPTGRTSCPVEFLFGLPLPELVARVAAESADTIVVYLAQFRDRDGRPYTPREVLRAISSRSGAPVYGIVETYLGFGMAAGIAESYADRGRLDRAAHSGAAGRWAHLHRTASCSKCRADAWPTHVRCSAGRWTTAPAGGCDIRFAEQPLWREYWWQILADAGDHRRADLADRDAVRAARGAAHRRGGVAKAPFRDGAHEPARGVGRDVGIDCPRAQSAARRDLQQCGRGGNTDQGRSAQARRGGGDPGRHQARRSACERHHCANPQDAAQVRVRVAGNGSQRGHRRVDGDCWRRRLGQGGRRSRPNSSPVCRRSAPIASSCSR